MKFVLASFAAVVISVAVSSASAQYGSESSYPVTGKVKDESGKSVAGVNVHAQIRRDTVPGQGGMAGAHVISETDGQGSFTLHILEGAHAAIFANQVNSVVDYKIVKQPTDAVDLVLKSKGRRLAGIIKDSEGNPVPGALVGVAANTRESFQGASSGGPWRLGLREAGELQTTADAAGRFEIINLPDLPLIVWAVPAGDRKALQQQVQFSAKKPTVDLGEGDVTNYEAVLDPPPRFSPSGLQ